MAVERYCTYWRVRTKRWVMEVWPSWGIHALLLAGPSQNPIITFESCRFHLSRWQWRPYTDTTNFFLPWYDISENGERVKWFRCTRAASTSFSDWISSQEWRSMMIDVVVHDRSIAICLASMPRLSTLPVVDVDCSQLCKLTRLSCILRHTTHHRLWKERHTNQSPCV